MDGRRLIAEVLREAGRLGLSHWERLVLILAVALLVVLGRQGWEIIRSLPVEPQPLDPERDPSLPDAVAVDANGTPVGTRPESELSQGGEG